MIYDNHHELIDRLNKAILSVSDDMINEGHQPNYIMGIVMVIVARQFERFNYSPEDFINFLEHTKTLAWYPEPPKKPHLILVKNENFTSNSTVDS